MFSRVAVCRSFVAALTLLPRPATASYFSTMSFSTQRDGSGTVTITPKNEGDQSGLVVICHGLGDTAEGFVDVAEKFAAAMPHVKFILPTAPTQPVTMNMGMAMPSWYDITGLDERSNENCKGIDESRDRVVEILAKEHAETQLPYSRMVLGGFSQGGALSLWTGLQLPEKLAGVLMMSSYLPAAGRFAITAGLEDTPIVHLHGAADPMIKLEIAEKTKETVTTLKGATNYKLKSYPGLQHSINMQELGDALEFLQSILPADDTCKIKLKDPSEMSVKELKAAIRKAGLGQQARGLMEKPEFIKLLQDHRAGKL